MKELNFDTGIVTYNINGKCEVSFNPTDSAFVEKLFNSFDTLDQRQETYRAEVERLADKREIFQTARKMDGEMRDIINDLFGWDVCAAVFGHMNVYAMAGGLPVWANLLLTLMDEIDSGFAREQKATNPRIEKYMKKYHK